MAKIRLNGETFDWDGGTVPMSEALAVEKVYKRRYAQWEDDLGAGSAEAFAVLAWLIWRRDGRQIPYEDIIGGTIDFDLVELLKSLSDAAEAAAAAEAEAGPDPTTPGS